MTPDPWKWSAVLSNPQSWNRYAYVQGDPVNFNDPSGQFMVLACGNEDGCLGASFVPDRGPLVGPFDSHFWAGNSGAGTYLGQTFSLLPVGGVPDTSPAGLAMAQMNKVKLTVKEALGKSDCLGLFGTGAKDPVATLDKMLGKISYEDKGKSYVAEYNPITGWLTINTHTDEGGTYWNTDWYLQTIEDAVTLLHELGHSTSSNKGNQFQNDTSLLGNSDAVKSWQNDALIWKNCFGRDDPFPKPAALPRRKDRL